MMAKIMDKWTEFATVVPQRLSRFLHVLYGSAGSAFLTVRTPNLRKLAQYWFHGVQAGRAYQTRHAGVRGLGSQAGHRLWFAGGVQFS